MSGVSLMFHDYIDETTLLMTLKDKQYLCLYIENDIQEEYGCIYLDKLTAIKLCKELKKQIAILDYL